MFSSRATGLFPFVYMVTSGAGFSPRGNPTVTSVPPGGGTDSTVGYIPPPASRAIRPARGPVRERPGAASRDIRLPPASRAIRQARRLRAHHAPLCSSPSRPAQSLWTPRPIAEVYVTITGAHRPALRVCCMRRSAAEEDGKWAGSRPDTAPFRAMRITRKDPARVRRPRRRPIPARRARGPRG